MTEKPKYRLHNAAGGAAVTVRIMPSAKQNKVLEILDDGTIHVSLQEPEGSGKTNQALIAFLAEVLQVPAKQIEVVAGAGGQDKLVTILEMDSATVQEKVLKAVKG